AGKDLDAVGDHEGRIKADTEAADQRLPLGALTVLPAFDAVQKGFGTGARNRTERIDQLVTIHADAVVFNAKLAAIERHSYARLGIIPEKRGRVDRSGP